MVRLNEGLESLGTREAPAGKNKKRKAHTNGGAFRNSGIAEISLPGSLVKLQKDTFDYCPSLRTIWVAGGCAVDVRGAVHDSMSILPAKDVTFGGRLLWDLRALGKIVLPEKI